MNIRYRVELGQTERDELKGLLSGGRHAARKLKRAQILLATDAGANDKEIARGGYGVRWLVAFGLVALFTSNRMKGSKVDNGVVPQRLL
jgi:hypothetical protein